MGDPLVDDSWPVGQGMTFTILQNPLRTRLHTKGEAAFMVPPHWHTMHDEHHTVLKGTLTVMIQDGVRRVVQPEDGPLLTRRGVVHSLEILPGEEAIVEETTLQSDDVHVRMGFEPAPTHIWINDQMKDQCLIGSA
ncbi:hypothetical protein B0H14DRAFT_2638458 [Mycena olivaceomarginata]|nr:hypothetical protein B0H14DRAFT_2638458 [Mycena olivaceomarginata]